MDPKEIKKTTDHQLMALLNEGESQAFEELVRRYQTPIINFVYRLIKDPNRALDLSQETFLRVFQNAYRYTPKASFSTWIYTIAANLAKDELKSRRVKRTLSLNSGSDEDEEGDGLLSYFEDAGFSPQEDLETKEREQIIWEILDTIHEPYRSTLILRDFQELPYEEIAKVQECSLGTVKSRVNRARLQFKEKYVTRYLKR